MMYNNLIFLIQLLCQKMGEVCDKTKTVSMMPTQMYRVISLEALMVNI